MTGRNNIKTKARSAASAGALDMHTRALMLGGRVAQLDTKAKGAAVIALSTIYFLAASNSIALANGCNNSAATKLVGFIDSAAKFIMLLGGAGALLMLALAAGYFIFGSTGDRVKKGISMIKNVVIGLAVLASGFFIQEVVLSFVSGATGGGSTPGCLNRGTRGVG